MPESTDSYPQLPTETYGDARSNEYHQAIAYLYDRLNYERRPGTGRYPFRLQRTATLASQLGLSRYLYEPGRRADLPLVHIAGTKGKGSTATMVAAVLSAAGLRTGLYTSPHLHNLEERFRIDGRLSSGEDIIRMVDRIRPVAEKLAKDDGDAPSFFELTTAMALMHFDDYQCDAMVLEVGLGGKLDSTNVCLPSVTAITSIGLDHQRVLGNTTAEIASAKAGIIKREIPVVSGVTDPAANRVITDVANEHQAPLFRIDRDFSFRFQPENEWGSRVEFEPTNLDLGRPQKFELSLDGQHQAQNAAVAMAVLALLRGQGVAVTEEAFGALGNLSCEGRIERFRMPAGRLAIVDTAHNQDSIRALCECLQRRCLEREICVVFGTSGDKSAAAMLNRLSPLADKLLLTRFHSNPRFRPTAELLELVPDAAKSRTFVLEDPLEACRSGLKELSSGGVLVVCGSFFLAAETRDWLAQQSLDKNASSW